MQPFLSPKTQVFYFRFLGGALLLLLTGLSSSCTPFNAQAAFDAQFDTVIPHSEVEEQKELEHQLYVSNSNLHDAQASEQDLNLAFEDKQNRVNDQFQIPKQIQNKVFFWMNIYARYSSEYAVLYDRHHPEVIYDVLDFRDLRRKTRSAIVYEILRNRRIIQKLRFIQGILHTLAIRKGKPSRTSAEQNRIAQAVKKCLHKHSYYYFAQNLRSQTGQRDAIIGGLLKADPFLPRMEKIFSQLQIPKELTRIALVESSFQVRAYSRVGAQGVWQFMPVTGREFLYVNPQHKIDERLSPLKATVAAARLLRRNKTMLRSWELATISYNSGYRALRRIPFGQRQMPALARYLQGCRSNPVGLGWAGQNYYAEFLALLYTEAYRDLFYGNAPQPTERGIIYKRVNQKVTPYQFSIEAHVPLASVLRLNPELLNPSGVLPVGLWLAIPGEYDDLQGILSARSLAETRRLYRKNASQ